MSKLSELLVTRETFESDKYQDLLAASKYERLSWDDFRDTTYLETPAMTFQSNGYAFTAGQILTGKNILDPEISTYTVTECFLLIAYSDTGTPTIEITADGGTNWETAINNNIHNFVNPGSDVRIRFTGGGTGVIYSWAILYYPHTSSLIEEAVALTGKGINTHATLPDWDEDLVGTIIYVSQEAAHYACMSDKWTRISPPPIMENLLSNSGLGVWGDADGLYECSDNLFEDGTFDSDISNWTDTSTSTNYISWTSTQGVDSGGGLLFNLVDAGYVCNAVPDNLDFLRIGILYKLKFTVTVNDDTTNNDVRVYANGVVVHEDGTLGEMEVLFVPSTLTDTIIFQLEGPTVGTAVIDNVEIYEVGPGSETLDTHWAISGWHKTLEAKVYRCYLGETEAPKTSYYVKMLADASVDTQVGSPHGLNRAYHKEWMDKVKGRTITFGAWLWCDTVDQFRIVINHHKISTDSLVREYSNYHPGDSSWHWLEVSNTIPEEDIDYLHVDFILSSGTAEARGACPMLIYGDYIGEGNWAKKSYDSIPKTYITSNKFNGVFSSESGKFNIQVDTEGKLPYNIDTLGLRGLAYDSGSASSIDNAFLVNVPGNIAEFSVDVGGILNSARKRGNSTLCLEEDVLDYEIRATGVETMTIVASYCSVTIK